MGKFRQFVTELFAHDMIMILFVMSCCVHFSSFPLGIYFNAFEKKRKYKEKVSNKQVLHIFNQRKKKQKKKNKVA